MAIQSPSATEPHIVVPAGYETVQLPDRRLKRLRYALAIVVGGSAFFFIGDKILEIRSNLRYFDNAVIDQIAYSDPVKAAIAQKSESTRSVFQTSLVLMAVLWGLVLTKKDEKKLVLGDVPEWVLFIIANACFAASFYCYSQYTDILGGILTIGNIDVKPEDLTVTDFRDMHLEFFARAQLYLWVVGVVVTAFTLFSAHILKSVRKKRL